MARASSSAEPARRASGVGRLLARRRPTARARRRAAIAPGATRARVDAASEERGSWPRSRPRPRDLEALARQTRDARRARRSGRSSRPRRSSPATRGSSSPRWTPIDAGATRRGGDRSRSTRRAGRHASPPSTTSISASARGRCPRRRPAGRRSCCGGRGDRTSSIADGAPAIIVADDLDPSAVAALRPELVGGHRPRRRAPRRATPRSSPAALGIPLVLGLGGRDVELLLDGARCAGRRRRRPGVTRRRAETQTIASATRDGRRRACRRCAGRGDVPVGPVDGERRLGRSRRTAAARAGAAGIGLVRTELLFLGRTVAAVGRRAAARLYRADPRRDGRPAGRLPDARRRRRQAGGVAAGRRRGEPGARRPRRPARPRIGPRSSTTSSARCSRPPPVASSGSCCRWSRPLDEVVAVRAASTRCVDAIGRARRRRRSSSSA